MLRANFSVAALIAAAALLSACKPSSTSEQAAPTPPPPPTPAQVTALVATLPAPFNTGDVQNGKERFVQCAACHTITEGGPNLTGPNLYGVFGRKAGSKADFNYSDGLKAAGFTWDAAHINQWITDPRAMIPGTKMTFVGLPDPKDRIDVIAYLKSQTTPPPPGT
ncbi:MAG TPA: cytochrome c family protein [Caulobacteraceae bacterium]|jgi:cytochrome c|nr:cytochrome c family protein [Caulobacteraceae bacterium]